MDERFYPKVEIILRCNFALSLSSLAWLELDGMTTKERGRGPGAAVRSVVRRHSRQPHLCVMQHEE